VTKEDFIWLPEIVEKLQDKHGVEPEEVEEVFTGRPRYFRGPKGRRRRGENVYFALGPTLGNRYLFVVYIKKRDGRALILSARDMTSKERRRYQRK
jgi:hypothetical protein